MNGVQAQQMAVDGNTISHNCNHNGHNTNHTGYNTIAMHFLAEYYRCIFNIGWNATQYLFAQSCVVMCKDRLIGNAYDLLNALSMEYIKRANYDIIHTKWIPINKNRMIISVFGRIQFVSFSGVLGNIMYFSETFILSPFNGDIKCTHHIFDFQ